MNLDDKGLSTRRAVLGDSYVDGALAMAEAATQSAKTGQPVTLASVLG